MTTIWRPQALDKLEKLILYIQQDSFEASEKVALRILEQVNSLSLFPNKFAIEPHVSDEARIYRFITVWSYKIIYRVGENEIRVVDIFHAKRNPDSMRGEE